MGSQHALINNVTMQLLLTEFTITSNKLIDTLIALSLFDCCGFLVKEHRKHIWEIIHFSCSEK